MAAVLMSFVAEPPLTGPGAGGFMLVHTAEGESRLLDFFVAAPGLGLTESEPAPLVPIDVTFAEGAVQRFNVGPASCGAYGTTAGMAEALRRFGTLDLAGLCEAPARAAREGVEVVPMQAFLFRVLEPIFRSSPEASALLAPEGDLLQAGETMRFPELGDLLERLGREGPSFLYDGDVGRAVSAWVLERGGRLSADDLAAYQVAEREPVRVQYSGRDVLTNPPPSSGGILIADALGILERLAESDDPASVAEVIATTNRARDEEFLEGLASDGYLERFLAADALDSVAGEVRSRLGSTTHIAVLDADGNCATVTCSNGSCSGVVVPGTGVHLNNMLGEDDLNPFGHHLHPAGARVPSMMAPTVVLREGEPEVALGSAGSNRIRSAILQTILGVVDDGLSAQEAVDRPRLHVEGDVVEAEPGIAPDALDRLDQRGYRVRRWEETNLFFGGVQAVARTDGELRGGGDPRRGGVVARA